MGILNKIPASEREFLNRNALEIMSAGDNGLETVLKKISRKLSDRDYGWSEAVLDRKWHRYPGEIKSMRFCSEEALKNYLLCKCLGIPATYLIAENFDNGSLCHEMVLVGSGDETYLLDWELDKVVRKEDKCLVLNKGKKVTYGRLYELEEDEVFDRVCRLRSSESFLDALKSGQHLYSRHYTRGLVDAYVKYIEHKSAVEFTITYFPYSAQHYVYFTSRLNKKGRTVKEEIGIAYNKNNLNMRKIPLLKVDHANCRRIILPVGGRLDDRRKREVICLLLHDSFASKGRTLGKIGNLKEEYAYIKDLASGKEKSKDWKEESQRVLEIYDDIICRTPKGANFYLDAYLMHLHLGATYKKYGELREAMAQRTGIKNIRRAVRAYLSIISRDLGRYLFDGSAIKTQQILCEALASKLSVKKFEFQQAKIFNLFSNCADSYFWRNEVYQ